MGDMRIACLFAGSRLPGGVATRESKFVIPLHQLVDQGAFAHPRVSHNDQRARQSSITLWLQWLPLLPRWL
jgi:hypothetical protein